MRERTIFHVDVNAAFLSWEATYRLTILGESMDLREVAAAIGGNTEERKGIILAKSMAAKKYGVQTGESIYAAKMKCPHLVVVSPHYELYEQCSAAFMKILREYTPIVEQYSIDEAFMDMTGTEGLYGDLIGIAYVIKDQIARELGFTVNIGISSNKLLAKMASDFEKPNKVHTLYPDQIKQKMWPLPVRELFFVGGASEERLKKLGIRTIGQLAQADRRLLRQHLNKQGEMIWEYANGMDSAYVLAQREPHKGYGNSMTIPYDVDSKEEVKKIILSLCETVATRLRADDAKVYCIRVSLVDTYFEHSGHQKTLTFATYATYDLYNHACEVFDELWNHRTPIRQIGVHTSKVEYGKGYQMNLFEMQTPEKYNKLDQAIDQIRKKFGDDSVIRATFVGGKLNHMAGGIHGDKNQGIIKR